METLEEFKCDISEVGKATFWARMIDLKGCEQFGEFLISKIPVSERRYIAPGAWFTWTIYRDGSTHEIKSKFEFDKRTWTQEEIDEGKKEGERLAKALGIE